MPASLRINLKADFVNNEKIQAIEAEINDEFGPAVFEIAKKEALIESFNKSVLKITAILGAAALLLLLIVITLINNTVLLSIYSKRFLIKTMQMVGATGGFIRKPFIWQGIAYGFFGGILADGLLFAGGIELRKAFPEFFESIPLQQIVLLFTFVVFFGILIAAFSSMFAVNRFLKSGTSKLY